jgi:O-antigen ligase
MASDKRMGPLILAAAVAAAGPSLLAYNPAPSPTFLNQALAIAAWGVFVGVAGGRLAAALRAWPLLLALAGLGGAALWSWGPGELPASLALSALGMLAAAAVMVAGGAASGASVSREQIFIAFCWGWVIAGLLNCGVAVVQVFAPSWPDGVWLARSGFPGRAVGNLRQPNHLSSLLLWSAIASIGLLQLKALRPWPARGLFALLMAALVLTASRTGLVSVLLLCAWGLLDRHLARGTRQVLIAAPLLYAIAWWGMWLWAQTGEHSFGGQARLQETDISSSRFGIWANALALIARQPWAGVGFGEFNLAWSMTPFPGRPTAFFDHAHNLPLQLAVELGLPLAGAVLALLAWALWRAWRAGRGGDTAARCACVLVGMIGMHSLLEYPMWYAYFLLPAAWAWGFALAELRSPDAWAAPARWAPVAAALMLLGSATAVLDYGRVTRIFDADARAAPLAERVADGRRSWLFSHHADYAAATTGLPQADGLGAFDGAKHYLLDTRLMVAWADALAASGQIDAARHVAARLREFGAARAASYFAACGAAASAAVAYQCQPPATVLDWRALVAQAPSPPPSTPSSARQ